MYDAARTRTSNEPAGTSQRKTPSLTGHVTSVMSSADSSRTKTAGTVTATRPVSVAAGHSGTLTAVSPPRAKKNCSGCHTPSPLASSDHVPGDSAIATGPLPVANWSVFTSLLSTRVATTLTTMPARNGARGAASNETSAAAETDTNSRRQ